MQAMMRRGGENPAIQRRREQDAKTMQIAAVEKDDFRRAYVSDWQAKSALKVEQIQIQNIAKQLQHDAAKVLEVRRQNLAELLMMEEDQYRRELANVQESTIDKLQHTLSIARQQRSDKEDRRKQYAQEQYMRMWRAGCDDLRTIDSETFAKHTKQEQQRQAVDKRTLNAEQLAEQEKWHDLWEADRERKLQREREDAAKKALMAAETRETVSNQIMERSHLRQDELRQKAMEREEWVVRVKQEQAEAEIAKRDLAIRKAAQAKSVSEWNEEMLQKKKEEKARQAREDKRHVEQLMADFELELQRKRADRLSMQREMSAYRDYLVARKAEERRLEEEMDAITFAYQQLTNQKQDAEWAKNEAQRSKLMADVNRVRQQQIDMKKAEREQLQSEAQKERARVELDILVQKQAEEQEEAEKLRQELQAKIDLEMQIRQKANVRALDQARLRQEDEAAAIAEAQYREFIRLEQGRARISGPSQVVHSRKATDWNSRYGE